MGIEGAGAGIYMYRYTDAWDVAREQGKQTQGFDAELSTEELGDYSPLDEPEVDARNPRYTGPQ